MNPCVKMAIKQFRAHSRCYRHPLVDKGRKTRPPRTRSAKGQREESPCCDHRHKSRVISPSTASRTWHHVVVNMAIGHALLLQVFIHRASVKSVLELWWSRCEALST